MSVGNHRSVACEQALSGVGGGGGVGKEERELATMSQEFVCRRRRKDSKVQSYQMHFERRESLLRKILLFLIECATKIPSPTPKRACSQATIRVG